MDKKSLRLTVKRLVKALSPGSKVLQSASVAQQVCVTPAYLNAKRLGLFVSLPDEVDMTAIFEHAFAAQKTCFVPRYDADGGMEMYKVMSMEDIESLPKTKWNVSQPEDVDARENAMEGGAGLDLVLVPGLAFTGAGERMGRGKGYYDNYIQRCRKTLGGGCGGGGGTGEGGQRRPATIGVGFDVQIFDALPTEPHDEQLDLVVAGIVED